MYRKYLMAAAGLLTAGSLVSLLRGAPEAPQVRAEPAAGRGHEAERPEPGRRVGQALGVHDDEPTGPLKRYSVQVHNDFRPSSDASGLLVGFEGELTMGEVAHEDGLSWLYVHPDELVFTAESGEQSGLSQEQRAHLERELEQGYFAGRNAQGQIVAYRFVRQPSSVAQGFLRLIAVATQGVTPEGAAQLPRSWTVSEVDSAGEAQVRYERAEDDSWLKRKTAYTRVLTDSGLTHSADQRTVQGEGKLVFRGERLELATLTEHSTARFDSALMENDAEVRIVAEAGVVVESVEALRKKLAQLPSVSALSLPAIQERPRADQLRDVLAGKSYEGLLQDLTALSPEDEDGRRALLEQFEADLELNPEHAAQLGARMRGASERDQSLIISALSNAETPEATGVLRELSEDRALPEAARETATALLGFAREADEQTVARLERSSRDGQDPRSTTATLALGSLAKFSRDADPEQAESIVEQLLERLRKAQNPDQAMGLLSALGNSGDARLVEALEPWRVAQHPGVRAGAFYALRLIDGEPAARLMAQAALGDPDAYVRTRAMAGLAVKASQIALEAAQRSLATDSDAGVRMAALNILSMFPASLVGDALNRVAVSDPDESVRASAQGLLGRGA